MEATPKKPTIKKTPAKPHVARKPRAAAAHPAKPAAPKTPPVQAEKPAEEVKPVAVKIPHGKNFYAVGRRKTSVSQVLVSQGNGTITINQLPFDNYFQSDDLRYIVRQPMVMVGLEKSLNVKSKVHGGGIHSQAESLRHAISRAITAMNPESRKMVKKAGFLTRDPRVKERKKPGLKRARRAPQFSKR